MQQGDHLLGPELIHQLAWNCLQAAPCWGHISSLYRLCGLSHELLQHPAHKR